jgi:hypothetical protein
LKTLFEALKSMITKNLRSTKWILQVLLVAALYACQPQGEPLNVQTPPGSSQTATVRDQGETPDPSGFHAFQDPDTPVEILFIGNSHTFYNDLPQIFADLMASGGYRVDVGQAARGGWSLSDHNNSSTTRSIISKKSWDYVVLQERGFVANPETEMFPAVRSLDQLIRINNAETILFMTWGRREGLPSKGYPDYSSMQTRVTQYYQEIGDELGLTIAPVGTAWANVVNRDPDMPLWDQDGSHPGPSGSYLAACVFYAVFTGESPEGLEFITNLAPESAVLLQSIAAQTVLELPNE